MTRKAASTNVGLRKMTKDEVKVSFTNYGVIILSNRVVALFFLNRISDINFEFIVINKIIIRFIISDIGIIDVNSSFVL